jgi:hypothetical protein
MPSVFHQPEPKAARNITTDDVARLVTALQAASRPLTAAQLSVFMFAKDTEGNRRRVRAIASAGRPRIVSFPGSNGYDLLERCTQAELKHGIAAIRRQATSMYSDVAIYQGAYDRLYSTGQLPLL